jgi:flagellar biosynthetic protein FliQ
MTLAHQAMYVGLVLAAPLLLVALVVGLVVSLFQAATQINESTLSFIPKLLAIVVTLVIAGPWMLTTMLDYLRNTLTSIPTLVN